MEFAVWSLLRATIATTVYHGDRKLTKLFLLAAFSTPSEHTKRGTKKKLIKTEENKIAIVRTVWHTLYHAAGTVRLCRAE